MVSGRFKLLIVVALLIVVFLVVDPVAADTTETFQKYGSSIIVIGTTGAGDLPRLTLPNPPYNYAEVISVCLSVNGLAWGKATSYIQNADPLASNYGSVVVVNSFNTWGGQNLDIILYDSSGTELKAFTYTSFPGLGAFSGQWEVIRDSSTGVTQLWRNGTDLVSSATIPTAFSYMRVQVNNSVGGGPTPYAQVDNYHLGSTNPRYQSSAIPLNWSVVKDFINPASSGLYANTTQIRTSYMYSLWSRGNGTTNDTVSLKNVDTGVSYETLGMGPGLWNITVNNLSVLTDPVSTAPFGLYEITIDGGGSSTDNRAYFMFTGSGAYVTWDQEEYTEDEVATITYTIGPTYWDTVTYDYYLRVLDQSLTTIQVWPIVTASDSETITIDDAFNDGDIYYATVYAVKKSDASEILMNYDYMEVNFDTIVSGYCVNATNGAVLSGCNVSVQQGSIFSYNDSTASGFYRVAGLYSGISTNITASKNYYYNHTYLFTPLEAKTYDVNQSLTPVNLTSTNATIGGVVYSTSYHTPIEGAMVNLTNGTYQATVYTSLTGWYNFTGLLENTSYWIQAYKSGYALGLNVSVVANSIAPITSFISDFLTGIAPKSIQFNDTSAHYPTTYCWSYTNYTPGNNTPVYWSQIQNATETFGVGNWSIVLNASNSAGYNVSPPPYWINVSV